MARPPSAVVRLDHAVYEYWHARLLAGDVDAPDRLATMLHRDLHRLVRGWPIARGCDRDVIGEVIDETIEHYLERPTLFNPAVGHLIGYLTKSTENRLKDWRLSEARQHRRETAAALALRELIHAQRAETVDERPDLIEFARPVCTSEELALLEAVIERKPLREKAATLGLRDAAPEEQRAAVDRMRERLVTRLRRRARRLGFYLSEP